MNTCLYFHLVWGAQGWQCAGAYLLPLVTSNKSQFL